MEDVFKSFCAFGAGRVTEALMDNSKFAKFARDMKLLDKKLTATDVDIIFNKPAVKSRTERKISYQQFLVALKLMAAKKYGDESSYEKLEKKILEGFGPKTLNTTKAVKAGAVDRLTDTAKYTGSHKERFNEEGKGKGLEGRYHTDETTQKAQQGYVGGYKGMDTYEKKH